MFNPKKSTAATPGKKKIIRDQRNYHVTQASVDLAAQEKARLEQGIAAGGRTLSFKDGVLMIEKGGR